MQQFPTYSPAVFEFSWWWVVVGVVFWAVVLGTYYRLFLTDVEKRRVEKKKADSKARKANARLETIRDGLTEAIRVAGLARESAEAAARRAELAPDGAAADAAASDADAAARRAEDSALAAAASAKALLSLRERKLLDKRGGKLATEADAPAAAARDAARRAATAARAISAQEA